MIGQDAGLVEGGEVEWGGGAFEEGLEPWPCGGADEAEQDGEGGEDDEGDGHHGGAFVRGLGDGVDWVFGDGFEVEVG